MGQFFVDHPCEKFSKNVENKNLITRENLDSYLGKYEEFEKIYAFMK